MTWCARFIADLQDAIGKALSDATKTPLSVTIENIDFRDQIVGSSAKVSLVVYAADFLNDQPN